VRSDKNPSIDKAMQFYDHGDFKGALNELEKAPIENYTYEVQFFMALSYIGNEKPDAACEILEKIKTPQYIEQVNWYLGLSYVLSNNHQQAREKLLQIQPDEFEYETAQTLLKKLK
jgi:predicted negative regulator of RcsB-dependent stress response